MAGPAPRPNIVERSPVAKEVEEFLGFLVERGASFNTIAAYRSDLEQLTHFREASRGGEANPLDRSIIEGFVADLKEHGYHNSSIARKLAAARSFFVFLAAEGSVDANPTDGLAVPREVRALPRAISAAEVAALLEQPAHRSTPAARRDRAMLELLYATGMRVSELVALDTGDISLDAKSARVRCSGRRGDERTIIVPRQTREALLAYLTLARPFLARDAEESALFLNRRGARITRQGLWFILKGYARVADLGAGITPHTLRHSFAAHKLTGGMTLSNVQRILGHSASSSTRIYSAFVNSAES